MKTYSSYSSTLLHEPEEKRAPKEDIQEQDQKLASKRETFGTNIIGWILQGGVILSAIIIALGLFLLPLKPGGLSLERLLDFPQTLGQVGQGLLILRP